MFSKMLLQSMDPFLLLAWRFLLALPIITIIFHSHLRQIDGRTFAHGVLLGLLYTIVMGFEMQALLHTATSTVSFLEHTAIVLVPVLEAVIFRKLPKLAAVMCTIAVMVGVGLLTLREGFSSFGSGEAFGLCGATVYSFAIIATDRFAKTDDPHALGLLQIGAMGFACLLVACVFETPSAPEGGVQWVYLAVLVLLCTVFGFTFQPVAQRYLNAQTSGMLCATNPFTAAALGIVVLGETFTLSTLAGMVLILGGIVANSIAVDKGESGHTS